jgi:hypothetical protein
MAKQTISFYLEESLIEKLKVLENYSSLVNNLLEQHFKQTETTDDQEEELEEEDDDEEEEEEILPTPKDKLQEEINKLRDKINNFHFRSIN